MPGTSLGLRGHLRVLEGANDVLGRRQVEAGQRGVEPVEAPAALLQEIRLVVASQGSEVVLARSEGLPALVSLAEGSQVGKGLRERQLVVEVFVGRALEEAVAAEVLGEGGLAEDALPEALSLALVLAVEVIRLEGALGDWVGLEVLVAEARPGDEVLGECPGAGEELRHSQVVVLVLFGPGAMVVSFAVLALEVILVDARRTLHLDEARDALTPGEGGTKSLAEALAVLPHLVLALVAQNGLPREHV